MKLLLLVSAIDIAEPPAGTTFWWQLFKGLTFLGSELVVIPFIGRAIQTPWWRSYDNPVQRLSKLGYSSVKSLSRGKLKPLISMAEKSGVDSFLGEIIENRWKKSIDKLMQAEKHFDAAIVFNVPIKPLEKVFRYLKSKYGLSVFYYDGDMPEVLPENNTFGYNYYKNIDLTIFDGLITNSEGVTPRLNEMGAKNVVAIHYGVDTDIYKPFPTQKNIDILFSGSGTRGREFWMNKMLMLPAESTPYRFAVTGNWPALSCKIENLGFLPYSEWLKSICSSYINLNISRDAHALVYGTSTYRVFELCSMGCAVVSNPYNGLDKWYTPRKEIYVLSDDENPADVYSALLNNKDELLTMGMLARKKTIEKHTCVHRAQSLLDYVSSVL